MLCLYQPWRFLIRKYKEKIAALQTDKDEKLVILYTSSIDEQYGFVQNAKGRGYDVLNIGGPLSAHWISKMEQSYENVSFARVDADTLDKLIQKDQEIPSLLTKEQEESLQPLFEEVLDKQKFKINFESMDSTDSPIIITQPEFIRRMKEQQAMGGGGFFGAFPETYNLVINANHEKITEILNTKTKKTQNKKVKQLTDIALLGQGMLKGEALNAFIQRSIELV